MAQVPQMPGRLDIGPFIRGDEYGTTIDVSINLTGYTLSAKVYSLLTGETLVTPTLTAISLASGQVNVGLSDVQTDSLPQGTYGFRLEWVAPGSAKRTALGGMCEVQA